jgi:hypothetical protein
MAEREQAEREKKKNSPYCGGSSSSSRRCGASFICSDEVAVGSVVYVLGGSIVILQQESSELLEELAKLADGQVRICSSRRGYLQNRPKRARLLLHRGMGHVAAAESICMNLHLIDKVLYGGITILKVLYEFAHR